MENTPLTVLNLCTPLSCVMSACQDPALLKYENLKNDNGEILLCYEVNSVQGCSIEPDRDFFLSKLLFIGQKPRESTNESAENAEGEQFVSLPQGHYLFTQCRSGEVLSRDEWLDLAIEQQKDGLWERNKLLYLLYVRFLFEDDAFVTQIFRTIEN